jgi:glycosyltransferase involved in cell wall biosynthesis
VKRIDLLIRGLAVLGTQSPELRVSWTHVGNGPEKPALVTLAAAELPSNVRWEMKEYRGKEALHEFYRANPIDMFLNVSQSEGTAVALIEALSVGIPVLCTSVGGNIEVAGNGNGMLIAANPSPEEVAEGMRQMLANPEELEKRRAASRALWEARYNAQKNYSAFAKSLRAV